MADEYADLDDLKLQIGAQNAADDSLLEKALTAASRRIDKRTGREPGAFIADISATARTFNPRGRVVAECGGQKLLVDDISSLTGLVVELGAGGTFAAITDYETGPDNALALGKAIETLIRPSGLWATSPASRIRVTARWGWPEVPAEIVEATLLLAARLFKRKGSPDGVSGVGEWGPVRVSRLDPDVEDLLQDFHNPGFA